MKLRAHNPMLETIPKHPVFQGSIMQVPAARPKGPTVNSQGRQPLVALTENTEPQRGGSPTTAPSGLYLDIQNTSRGLRPWLLTAAALRLDATCIILLREKVSCLLLIIV